MNLRGLTLNGKGALLVISWIPVAMCFNENVCYIAKIEGKSMRPTLNPNDITHTDWVLLWKWGAKNASNLHHNDIILFKAPTNPRKVYCKRIKGMQYDTLHTRHPYPKDVVNIPRNHVWVEGDNAFHSTDSNNFGPISTGLVIGKAIGVIWPPSRWGSNLSETIGREDARMNGIVV
ncbi:LADA_0G09032g1_1 [Lachancea dasiensis]|uniref:Mitochondrial inner membrane protease subunit 2 n=1 Tax=Lachancea dasiensis TaxID=1072105 RepID=A0A1G4JU94_9SACH|nr:LADA_0G09032g1_1 [Lachancea dasiensis]